MTSLQYKDYTKLDTAGLRSQDENLNNSTELFLASRRQGRGQATTVYPKTQVCKFVKAPVNLSGDLAELIFKLIKNLTLVNKKEMRTSASKNQRRSQSFGRVKNNKKKQEKTKKNFVP